MTIISHGEVRESRLDLIGLINSCLNIGLIQDEKSSRYFSRVEPLLCGLWNVSKKFDNN